MPWCRSLTLIFFLISAVLGINLFAGKMHRCTDPNVWGEADCIGTVIRPSGSQLRFSGGLVINQTLVQSREWILPHRYKGPSAVR
jgi:hypothetical protein